MGTGIDDWSNCPITNIAVAGRRPVIHIFTFCKTGFIFVRCSIKKNWELRSLKASSWNFGIPCPL